MVMQALASGPGSSPVKCPRRPRGSGCYGDGSAAVGLLPLRVPPRPSPRRPGLVSCSLGARGVAVVAMVIANGGNQPDGAALYPSPPAPWTPRPPPPPTPRVWTRPEALRPQRFLNPDPGPGPCCAGRGAESERGRQATGRGQGPPRGEGGRGRRDRAVARTLRQDEGLPAAAGAPVSRDRIIASFPKAFEKLGGMERAPGPEQSPFQGLGAQKRHLGEGMWPSPCHGGPVGPGSAPRDRAGGPGHHGRVRAEHIGSLP
ncbi:hypothetical protein QTO34_011845 [Cnephaeus nilssonii]|uniref:Uncharacterized protein n=1 Tax=Cnephaeus nilssonii TaxID=3371016 RepID=A0AA40HCD3_CNENI|nr:hypothetical protein QTO34_011845 [Eptesicus nilssonii]